MDVKLTTHFHRVRLRLFGAVPSLPHTSSRNNVWEQLCLNLYELLFFKQSKECNIGIFTVMTPCRLASGYGSFVGTYSSIFRALEVEV
jgi:hypothetical protein